VNARYEGMDYEDVVNLCDTSIQLLKEMEWCGHHTDYEDSWAVMTIACPCCMNAKRDGHKPTCRLKELIGD
jgi:hypothetical protein